MLDLLLLSVLSENDTDLISSSARCPLCWHWLTLESLKISGKLEESTLKHDDCEYVKKTLAVDYLALLCLHIQSLVALNTTLLQLLAQTAKSQTYCLLYFRI